jgi:hypothetical protein
MAVVELGNPLFYRSDKKTVNNHRYVQTALGILQTPYALMKLTDQFLHVPRVHSDTRAMLNDNPSVK